MISKTFGVAICGLYGTSVTIEVNLTKGFGASVIGAGDAVKEGLVGIRRAITSCGFSMPRQRLLINISPASIPKNGTGFDLPIAIAILTASGQLNAGKVLEQIVLTGELSFDGTLNASSGIIIIAETVRQSGFKALAVPVANAVDATLIKSLKIYSCGSLAEVIHLLKKPQQMSPVKGSHLLTNPEDNDHPDFSEVQGHSYAKRALEIAAAGGHHLLMVGPPGSGKSMLAKRFASILPVLTEEEMLEVKRIRQATGLFQ